MYVFVLSVHQVLEHEDRDLDYSPLMRHVT